MTPTYGTDCDDTDASVGSILYDADCDGVLTADDCDDNDNTDALLSGDCDGMASQQLTIAMMQILRLVRTHLMWIVMVY